MTTFTPISALIGGALIGLAAVLLMLVQGRIAGISGIANGLLGPFTGETGWRIAFVLGLISAPVVAALAMGDLPRIHIPVPLPLLVAGGFLVGFGTRLGHGCTSGHGVCGVARVSRRSLVATATFLVAGAVAVFVVRHLVGV